MQRVHHSSLADSLIEELPGILNWALEGCMMWQREGLASPNEIQVATAEYRQQMDIIGSFIDDCCQVGHGESELSGDLYRAYSAWCDRSGERPISNRAMGIELTERGFDAHKGAGGKRLRYGVSLKDSPLARGEVRLNGGHVITGEPEDGIFVPGKYR